MTTPVLDRPATPVLDLDLTGVLTRALGHDVDPDLVARAARRAAEAPELTDRRAALVVDVVKGVELK